MLSMNRKLSHKGFSLIELMVAAAILSLAIFGIFQAFGTSFLGMFDARDRTVATNYAREAMEDIKNMDFDQMITQSRNYIYGTKYEREVIIQESTNLKRITTKVYWKDRNGTWRMVVTSMVIHFIETTAGDAISIILIADPYNVLTEDDDDTDVHENQSIITAVLKDIKGNIVTTGSINISFSITTGSTLGDISPESKLSVEGKASTIFTATSKGEVIITASANELADDSVTIKITDPYEPVKIELTATPKFMTDNTSSESIIEAKIKDAAGNTVKISKEITFSVSGPGTLSAPTTISTVDEYEDPTGIATITVTSTGTGGTITVTASSTDLEPGVIDVITGGQISLSAFPNPVHAGENSEITVTTKDVNGVPINYNDEINLSAVPDTLGTLSPIFIDFSLTDNSSETVTFKTFFSSEGNVDITAIDKAVILNSDLITLNIIESLIPDHIKVSVYPPSIEAGETDFSTITAWVEADDNKTITNYIELINFNTTAGTFDSYNSSLTSTSSHVDENGDAVVVLYPSDTSDTAIITVSSEGLDDVTIEVEFYTKADHIKLVAKPQNIQVGNEKFEVEAILVDENDLQIYNYNESVSFLIVNTGIIKYQTSDTEGLTTNFSGGEVIIIMRSKDEAGTATIEARSYIGTKTIFGTLNIPVGISLELEGEPIYDLEQNTVSFNIMIVGASLTLEEMQYSWLSSVPEVSLNIITIDSTIVFDGEVGSDERIAISEENFTLSPGTYTIVLDFSNDVPLSGKHIEVTFNPDSGNYPVDFTIPTAE